MSNSIIQVESLGKKYILSHQQKQPYHTLRDVIAEKFKAAGKRVLHPFTFHSSRLTDSSHEEFWALKDVSFDIKQGDRVGIIGRNGAGKSTLLKILSRITEPTNGRVSIRGRVASLLEVGTGFHPELTGRENIYLNGAILGMTKAEIMRKFDEIVDFAEIEKFLDTPVKRYSSGMYVRLAFAVAAHLEPEILIVDEVLAVGDAQFQKKCLGKMGDISTKGGRTVLFVSHNMQAIRTLCSKAILLSEGKMLADAPVNKTIEMYQHLFTQKEFNADSAVGNDQKRRGTGAVRFTNIKMQDVSGTDTQSFLTGATIRFILSFEVSKLVENLYATVALRSAFSGEFVTSARHPIVMGKIDAGSKGKIIIDFPKNNLRPREYSLYFWLGNNMGQAYDVVDDLLPPLMITTNREPEDLGFHLTDVPGYFDIDSKLVLVD